MSWIFYVLSPVIIHLVISETTAMLAGNVLDSAAQTALSAVLTLPFAIWMVRLDTKRNRSSADGWQMVNASNVGSERRSKMLRTTEQRKMFRPGTAVLCLFAGGLLNALWSGILSLLQITSYFSNKTQEALLTSGILMQVLGPGLLVPITEELIFRGLFYARMRTRLQARQAIVLSAVFFALYHGNPIQMIYAFPMALLLALLYERGESLVYPILFHMGANMAAIVLTRG